MSDDYYDINSFTPAPGRLWAAHFKDGDDGEEWELPIIGWALVRRTYQGGGTDGKIEPVVMDEDKYPVTISDYCDSRAAENAFSTLYRGLRPQEANEATGTSLRLTPDGPGSRDEIIDYVRSVIEQRTTTNDDTDAERLARGIVTSILSRLGAAFSTAAGNQPQEGDAP